MKRAKMVAYSRGSRVTTSEEDETVSRVLNFFEIAQAEVKKQGKVNGYEYSTGDVIRLTTLMVEDYHKPHRI